MALTLNINGEDHVVDADSQMPLLWAIREKAGLPGTKFGRYRSVRRMHSNN